MIPGGMSDLTIPEEDPPPGWLRDEALMKEAAVKRLADRAYARGYDRGRKKGAEDLLAAIKTLEGN